MQNKAKCVKKNSKCTSTMSTVLSIPDVSIKIILSFLREAEKISFHNCAERVKEVQWHQYDLLHCESLVLDFLSHTNYAPYDVYVKDFFDLSEHIHYNALFYLNSDKYSEDDSSSDEEFDHNIYMMKFKELVCDDYQVNLYDRNDKTFLHDEFNICVQNQSWPEAQKQKVKELISLPYTHDVLSLAVNLLESVNSTARLRAQLKNYIWAVYWYTHCKIYLPSKQLIFEACPNLRTVNDVASFFYVCLKIINIKKWRRLGGFSTGDDTGSKGEFYEFKRETILQSNANQFNSRPCFDFNGNVCNLYSKDVGCFNGLKLNVTVAARHNASFPNEQYELNYGGVSKKVTWKTHFRGLRIAFDAKQVSDTEFVLISVRCVPVKKYFAYCIDYIKVDVFSFGIIKRKDVTFLTTRNEREWVVNYPQVAYLKEKGKEYAVFLKRRGIESQTCVWYKALLDSHGPTWIGLPNWSKHVESNFVFEEVEDGSSSSNFLVSIPDGVCMVHITSFVSRTACNVCYFKLKRLGCTTSKSLYLYRNNVFKIEYRGQSLCGKDIFYLYCFRHVRLPHGSSESMNSNPPNPFIPRSQYFKTYSVKKVLI